MTRNTPSGSRGSTLRPSQWPAPDQSTPASSAPQGPADALPDPAGYRAAHQHLERQVARLTEQNAALRGLLEQAILRLASATGNTETVIRCELGAPPRPTWNRGTP